MKHMNFEHENGLYLPSELSEQEMNQPELPSVVLYGGGVYGIGYKAGVMDEIRSRGIDLSQAYMLGTSAGSWVASMMATGVEFDDVKDMGQIKLRNYQQDYLYGYAQEVFGDARADNVNGTATRLPSVRHPKPQMKIMNGGEVDLARIAAASSSVPGLWSPANVNGERYWDGAVGGSGGYADRAPKSHTLLAVNALAQHLKFPLGPVKVPAGWALEAKALHEVRKWRRQHGGEVIYIRPNQEISNMAKDFKSIFDFELAKDVYFMAREQVTELLDDPENNDELSETEKKIGRNLGKLVARLALAESA